MEEELEECECKWYCSCKVLLKGKRAFPAYLELKEYQDLISGPPPKRRLNSPSSNGTGGRSGLISEQDDQEPSISIVGTVPVPIDDIQQGSYQTENGLNKLERKPTLVNGHPRKSFLSNGGAIAITTKTIENGITSGSPTKNKPNNGSYESEQNAKSNILEVAKNTTTGGINTPTKSGYNCRNREKFHKCPTCGKNVKNLLLHEKEHVLESSKPHACEFCSNMYATVASYERHLKTRHPKCILCGTTLTMTQIENQPQEEIGINQVNLCKKCRKNDNDVSIVKRRNSLSSVTDLNGRGLTTANGLEHEKPFEVFNNFNEDNGVLTMNGNGEHLEENNRQELPLPDATNGTGDGDDAILFCDYCGAMFDCSEDFLPHYQEHGKHKFECRYCLLPFTNSDEVFKHERSHEHERPFTCLFCPIKFRSQTEREFHERSHT